MKYFELEQISDKLHDALNICQSCCDTFAEDVDIKGKKEKVKRFLSKDVNIKIDINISRAALIAIGTAVVVFILFLVFRKKK